jgi:uncharacterized membrane protein
MTKIVANVIVDRPAEDVWKFTTDFSSYPKIHPTLVDTKQTSRAQLGWAHRSMLCIRE